MSDSAIFQSIKPPLKEPVKLPYESDLKRLLLLIILLKEVCEMYDASLLN